jgi:hypothetical protein
VNAQPTSSPESPRLGDDDGTVPEPRTGGQLDRALALVRTGAWIVARVALATVLTVGLTAGLVVAGLDIGPGLGAVAYSAAAPPRRPPIIPPWVPVGAREDWAVWSYVDKINQAWGKDWPLAIEWFEELDARYPGNPMVLDKLYVAYLEDARVRQMQGDLPTARQRYEQAVRFDPDRGVAQERLAELDAQQGATRR